MGDVDASGSMKHGTWFLEKNTKQDPTPWRSDDEATTHVLSLVGDDEKVKAFVYADLSDDKQSLYMNYAEVAKPLRGQGVYKSLLDSLSEQFRVVSDKEHNVATAAKKAYESLSARLDRYGHYVLDKKKKHEGRAFCPTGQGNGIDNSCGGKGVSSVKSAPTKVGGQKLAPLGDVSKRFASGEKSSKVLQELGFRKMNFTDIDKALKSADKTQRQRILSDLDTLAEAIKIEPRLANIPIRVGSAKEIFKNSPDVIDSLLDVGGGGGILGAAADAESGTLAVFTDHDEYDESEYKQGFNSSTSRASPIIHEMAHLDHYKNALAEFPHPGEKELPGVSHIDYSLTTAEDAGNELLKSDKSLKEKVKSVSEYATADVFEFVAEYTTGVAMGEMKNDKDLDRLCKAVGAKTPRRIAT
jgi:hypothetical protein